MTKQPKAPVKLFDGHDSSTSAAKWKARYRMVSIKEGYLSPSFWAYWCAPIHTQEGPRLLKYDHLSYKAILCYMSQRGNRSLFVKLCCKNFFAGHELLQGEEELLRVEGVKQKKKVSRVAAQSEEEIRERKNLKNRKIIEEAPSRLKEPAVELDSERMASDSFDEAVAEALDQASIETPRIEEEQTSQPTPKRRVKSLVRKGKRLPKPIYVDTPTPSSSDEAR